MDPTPAYEIAPMLLEAGEPSLPRRSRLAMPFGVFVLVGMGAVFAYVVGSPIQVHRAGFESVVEFLEDDVVYVKTLDGKEYRIVAQPHDTIGNILTKMSEKTGVPPEGLSLECWGCKVEGKELQGDVSLDDAGIDSSSRVFMLKRMDCPRPSGKEGGRFPLAMRRSSAEAERVAKDCGAFVSFSEDREDPMTWHLNLKGPAGSPYDGGNFPLTVSFPGKYPLKPPSLTFDTPVYHMNVGSDGQVCIPLLAREGYKPKVNVCNILLAVSAILEVPEVGNAVRPELARLFRENKAEYLEKAKASVES